MGRTSNYEVSTITTLISFFHHELTSVINKIYLNTSRHFKYLLKKTIEERISYIVQCKQNYLSGIYPADKNAKEKTGYKILIEIAKSYFDKNLYDDFALYFMEGQYLVQLWTAHLLLEYGQPNEELKSRCLHQIEKYADSILSPKIAEQERQWLETYKK